MKNSQLRLIVFAVLMSCSTAMIVSAAILFIHGVSAENFLSSWLKSISLSWPLVFVSILTIAPLINRFLDKIFERK